MNQNVETKAGQRADATASTDSDAAIPGEVTLGVASFADAESREILNLLSDSEAGGSCCGGACCSA